MAKFAELTSAYGVRTLINPEHVIHFERAGRDETDSTQTVLYMVGGGSKGLREPPEEVLARLCYPVSPILDGEQDPGELGAILADIQKLRRWSEDHDAAKTCETPAGNDELGKCWELLEDISDRLKALL